MAPTNMNRGFTLIELLVVIVIIGILSSVVVASIKGAALRSQSCDDAGDKLVECLKEKNK